MIIPLLGDADGRRAHANACGRPTESMELSPHFDDALLIVSELVTNAARQTPHEEIPQARPLPEVALDDLDARDGAFDDPGARGLPLVQALSRSCGVTKDPTGGKWIWARLSPYRVAVVGRSIRTAVDHSMLCGPPHGGRRRPARNLGAMFRTPHRDRVATVSRIGQGGS